MHPRTLQLHLLVIRAAKGMLNAWEHWVREQMADNLAKEKSE